MSNTTASISTNIGSFEIHAHFRLVRAIPFIPGFVFCSLESLFARIVNRPGANLPEHILAFVTSVSVFMTILFCYGFIMVCSTRADLRTASREAPSSFAPEELFSWRYIEPVGALLVAMSYCAPYLL